MKEEFSTQLGLVIFDPNLNGLKIKNFTVQNILLDDEGPCYGDGGGPLVASKGPNDDEHVADDDVGDDTGDGGDGDDDVDDDDDDTGDVVDDDDVGDDDDDTGGGDDDGDYSIVLSALSPPSTLPRPFFLTARQMDASNKRKKETHRKNMSTQYALIR